ncbi:purple acid phosphatase family protein [Arthrospiribacter ruber]|uniref:Metallophosphoesterase family protein n=1 Tax=Arthrospiribacter ruber TaxID=2487934 RepID=A0A951IXH2_9BACT|nr:metallophosphoesterase family protein [Arthrospiribacter ruber]MBW3468995.1 metallophosphoesterase family protein [Arthrospiribacter ruber]
MKTILIRLTILLAVFAFHAELFGQDKPYAFYLTWTEDPTTTIDIDWHLDGKDPVQLNIRRMGNQDWRTLESKSLPYPFSERWVHRVAVRGLQPNTTYEISFDGGGTVYNFRTMPTNLNTGSLKIAIGGDTMHRKEWFEKTNKVVASYDPDFVIIGGDMAYENGIADNIQRIYDWFDAYSTTLVTEENRILPCIVAIGNHEVVEGYHSNHPGYEPTNDFRRRIAPYFYGLFGFPGQPGYNILDFGKYLSLVILDTEHSNPIQGTQTEWLEKTLNERQDFLHRIPIYHVPGYPSVRKYDDRVQTLVREEWTPIFEKYGVRLAFENHDHAYKRTYPIKEIELDQSGIIYVGDGSWGVGPREVHEVEETWYLKKAQSVKAFTLLTLEGNHFSFVSIDDEGNIIDSFPEAPFAPLQ